MKSGNILDICMNVGQMLNWYCEPAGIHQLSCVMTHWLKITSYYFSPIRPHKDLAVISNSRPPSIFITLMSVWIAFVRAAYLWLVLCIKINLNCRYCKMWVIRYLHRRYRCNFSCFKSTPYRSIQWKWKWYTLFTWYQAKWRKRTTNIRWVLCYFP